jgi:uncharacterized membrane protein (DUF373 family)
VPRGTFDRLAQVVVRGLELLTTVVLAALVVLAIAGLLMELIGALHPPFLMGEQLARAIDSVLAVFVLLELLATAAAYLRGSTVLRRIFEAVFIAIARKLITVDLSTSALEKAAAVAMLFVAAGVAWWLVVRTRPPPPPA